MKEDWKKLIDGIERALKLRTAPVGIRFVADEGELKSIERLRIAKKMSFTCQLITAARTYGAITAITAGNTSAVCGNVLGLCDKPEKVKDGSLRNVVWCRTMEDAKKFEDAVPHVPLGKYKAVVIGPQAAAAFEPNMVLFYGNPAQMIIIINALQFEDYERFQFYCVGETSCSDVIAQCYNSGKPSLSIPCFGERRFGHAQDDELAIAIPAALVSKVNRNLEALAKRGIRYPIAYFGTQVDPTVGLPPAYHEILNITEHVKAQKK